MIRYLKKIIPILLLTFLCGLVAVAQKEGNFWAFTTRCGLDFNSGSPVVALTAINTLEGSASVCDINTGRLLFYTDGNNVYNRNHAVMPGGVLLSVTGTPTLSTTQAAAIVSVPGQYGQYYVFSMEQDNPNAHLYYSVVDIRLDNGLGDVIPGRKAIVLDSGLTEKWLW